MSDKRAPASVRDSRERPVARGTLSAFRVPHTNSLTPTLSLAATRWPLAGPAGVPEFPDKP